jgi:hypothetical protein
MSTSPRQAVTTMEVDPRLPEGSDERFTGYGALGVPYSTGHYLALRRMAASSLGTPYRAVWHRDPRGRWTIFTTADPDVSCPRYFGSAGAAERVPAIEVAWRDDWTLDVTMGTRLSWRLELEATPLTRVMTSMGGATPQWARSSDVVLGSMGSMVSGVLRSGRIRLRGRTPNGPRFKAVPLQVWRVVGGHARWDGSDLGDLHPLAEQVHLEDFWLPQRGLFFAGEVRFAAPVAPRPTTPATAGHLSSRQPT